MDGLGQLTLDKGTELGVDHQILEKEVGTSEEDEASQQDF
jgi:hypothetical protein